MGNWRFLGGRNWEGTKFVPNKELVFYVDGEPDNTIYLEEDDLLTPGILDFHAHLWSHRSVIGVADVQLYSEGVVGCVDAGSFGYNDWLDADRLWRNGKYLQIRSFMSIFPEGLTTIPKHNTDPPEQISVDKLVEVASKAETNRLLGFKVHLGWKDAETDRGLLKVARKAADKIGTRIMVHISGTYIPIEEITSFLNAGDIITHAYSGFQGNILGQDNKIVKSFFDAKDKGIVMDVAHAGKHFAWKVYKEAIAEGGTFDTISTDITKMSWKNTNEFKMIDIFHVISGILNTGISLDEAFKSVTSTPAKLMGIELLPSKQLLVLKKYSGQNFFADGFGEQIEGNYEYKPVIFIDGNKAILKRI